MARKPGLPSHLTVAVIILRHCLGSPVMSISSLAAPHTFETLGPLIKILTLPSLITYGLNVELFSHRTTNKIFRASPEATPQNQNNMPWKFLAALIWCVDVYMYWQEIERFVEAENSTSANKSYNTYAGLFNDRMKKSRASDHPALHDEYGSFVFPMRADDRSSTVIGFKFGTYLVHDLHTAPFSANASTQSRLRDDFATFKAIPIVVPGLLGPDGMSWSTDTEGRTRVQSSGLTMLFSLRRLQTNDRECRITCLRKSVSTSSHPARLSQVKSGPKSPPVTHHVSLYPRSASHGGALQTEVNYGQYNIQPPRRYPRCTVNHGSPGSRPSLLKMT
ncbi:hypothetical protein WAI453_010832 [Rhynchosporium graminicola]